jgi:1-acyl-sn-glycerol-3-phosphate acyltransferase
MRNLIRFVIRSIIWLAVKVEVFGLENIPSDGSFLIATNHLGILDAALAFYVLDRWDMYVMVAEKWEDHVLTRWVGRYFNFVFIDRFNPDLKALRKIIALMKEGNVLVVAPEGTRSRVGSLIEGKPGISYLATKLGYPIVPVALAGTEDRIIFGNMKRLRRSHVTVTAGKAFSLPPLPRENHNQVLQDYTDEIMCRIAAMLPEKYRGVYAGHPKLMELLQLR